jgi:hypothetical protein
MAIQLTRPLSTNATARVPYLTESDMDIIYSSTKEEGTMATDVASSTSSHFYQVPVNNLRQNHAFTKGKEQTTNVQLEFKINSEIWKHAQAITVMGTFTGPVPLAYINIAAANKPHPPTSV